MIVATAGHVDHGKSALVRALTGVDPDRWPEERARGLTIGLGFATCRLPSGRVASFVDVPGHHRFLPTMLAGAGGAAVSVLAVAATEGWRAQTDEHVRILGHLGVTPSVVAVTMAGRVDPDCVVADVTTRLPGAAVVAVDSIDGMGLDRLAAALDGALAIAPTPVDLGRPRLWVDRAFTVRGAGTVVTGTLRDGWLATGDDVVIAPGARRARVRGLQEHGADVDQIGPGRRAAVRLSGVDHRSVGRGDVLVRPDEWGPVDIVDVDLTVDAGHRPPVGRRGAWLAYAGTAEHAVLLSGPAVATGTTDRIRLRLPIALPLRDGDIVILRDAGRGETVGGGPVSLIASSGGPRTSCVHKSPEPDVDPWLEAIRLGGFEPPAVPAEVVRVLARQRRIVGSDGLWFHPDAVVAAGAVVRATAAGRAEGVTVGEVREALGTNRRRALALLALLDAAAVTRRTGERRVVLD